MWLVNLYAFRVAQTSKRECDTGVKESSMNWTFLLVREL